MQTVGVRELKSKLREYLRRVRLGERVLVAKSSAVLAWLLDEPTSPAVRRLLADADLIVASDERTAVAGPRLLSLDQRVRPAAKGLGIEVVPA